MSAQPEQINTDKFQIDDGTVNYGNEYQEKCVALFTLKLLDEPTVENFWLTSNMKGMSPFDDLFICTIENGRKTIYLVQIKHNRKQKSLRDEDFVKKTSKLHIKKFSTYQKLLDANSHRYPKEFQPADRVRIIVFTNRPLDTLNNTALERLSDYHFLSTSQEIYAVKTDVVLDQKLELDFASKFLVYTSQFDLDDPSNIPDKFQNYITNWLKIESEKFALTKPHSSRLYHFATLHKHLQWPKAGPCEQPWAEHIWAHLQTNFGIATLDFIESMIQNDRGVLIENEYNNFFSRILFGTALEGLQLDQLAELKGVVGVNPLVVVMDEGVDVEVAGMFKMVGVKGNGGFEKFETLRNIGKQLESDILNTKISLQGRQMVTLRDVLRRTDEITIAALLDVLKLGCIGDRIFVDEDCYIARKLYRIFVAGSTIQKNQSDMFVIKTNIAGNDQQINEQKYILVNEYDDVNLDQLAKQNVHFLGKTNLEDTYEWNGTFGSIDGIKSDFFFTSTTIELEKISTHYKSHLLVISGVPGIGKTMCTKEIACNISSNRWVLLVNLNDEILYFNKLLRCTTITAEQHLQHFFKENHCEMSSIIFARKLRDKKITIIFDAFDEIAPKFTKVVAGMIKIIRDAGFKMIVTTRSVIQERIEQEFGTVSLSLVPFDETDIDCYVTAKLEDEKFRNGLLGVIHNSILTFCTIPLHLKLAVDTAVEEFNRRIVKIVDTNSSGIAINQLQLYKNYIDMKLALFSTKIGLINIDEEDIEKYHKYFAVETLFQNQLEYECIQARMKVKLEDYEEKLANGSEKTGLLVADYKEGVFIHRTIAEYYAALWFLDHTNKPEVEIKAAMRLLKLVILKPEFSVVRMFMELHCASNDFNREEFVDFVLEHEVDFKENLIERGGNALHVVAMDNQWNLADILLTCGCDINNKNDEGETALHRAALAGSNCVAKLLISEGADVNCVNNVGKTPLHYAAISTRVVEYDYMCRVIPSAPNIEVNKKTVHSYNAQHAASKLRYFDIINVLLGKGADINSTTDDGMTLMHFIVTDPLPGLSEHLFAQQVDTPLFYGDERLDDPVRYVWKPSFITKSILDANPNCNICNESGESVVNIAASNFLPHNLEMILAVEGIDPNVRDKKGWTPLHVACNRGRFRNVRLLVANNADVNICDNEGITPLHLLMGKEQVKKSMQASDSNEKPGQIGVGLMVDYLKCIQALLVNGADWTVKNKEGRSPYDVAKDRSIENVFELLNKVIDYRDDLINTK